MKHEIKSNGLNSVISDTYGGTQFGYITGAYIDPNSQFYDYGYGSAYASGYDPGYGSGYDQGYAQGYDQGYHPAYDQGYVQGYDPAYAAGYDTVYSSAYGHTYPQLYEEAGFAAGYGQYYDSYSQGPGYSYPDDGYQEVEIVDSHDSRYHSGRESYGKDYSRRISTRDRSHSKVQEFPEQDYFSGNFEQVGYTDPYETRTERSYCHPRSTSSGRYKEQMEQQHSADFKTVMLDISNRKTTKSIIYNFDDTSQTHTFTAAEGYLFEGAIDENAEMVWVPDNKKYADKITVTQTGPGLFSIKAFVPVEGTSSSDFDTDKDKLPGGRRLDKKTGRPEVTPRAQCKVVQREQPKQFEITQRQRGTQQVARGTIDIELNNRKSSEQVQYHYNKRYFIHSFKPKAGFKIGRVTRGGKVKYAHQQGPIPDEVIVIVLPNGSEVLRVLYPSVPSEVESEGEYVIVTERPTLVEVDIRRYESSEGVIYTFDKRYNIHRFTCKENYLIRKITKRGEAVRRFPDNQLPDRLLIVYIPGKGSTLRVLYPGQDEGIDEILKLLPPPGPAKVEEVAPTLITVDVKRLRSTGEIDYREEADGTRVFVCKSGFLIGKIVKEDEVLERFSKDYPNKVTVSLDQNGKRVVDYSAPFKPELITLDIRRRMSSSQFKYEKDYKGRDIYEAIRPHLFYEVRKDNDLLWYSRDGRYPDKVYIIPVEGAKPILRVYYPKDVTFPVLKKVEGYRPDMYRKEDFEEPPEPKLEKPSRARDVYQHPKSQEPHKKEPEVKPTKAEPEVETEKPTIKDVPTLPDASQIKIVDAKEKPLQESLLHPVTLNISQRKNTDSFTYNASGKLGKYKANLGYAFQEVYENDKNKIWDTIEPDKYAVEVYADGVGFTAKLSNVTIYTANKQYIHFHKHNGKTWIKIPPILELDIEHKGSTLQVYYEPRGKTHVFFANYNFLFNKVLENGKVVWDSQGCRECVMVHYNEKGDQGKEVTVYLPDGVVALRKDETTKQWIDLDAVEGSGQKEAKTMTSKTEIEIMRDYDVNKLKIYTAEGDDITKTKENDSGVYVRSDDGEDRTFEMNDGTKCVEVKYNNKSFWKYEKEKYGIMFPKSVQFQKEKLSIVVEFGPIALKYKFNGEEMQLIFTRKPGPVEVDMSKTEIVAVTGTSGASNSYRKEMSNRGNSKIVTYTTKEQFAFNPVKVDTQSLYGTIDPFSYVYKIMAQPPENPKRLRIFYLNGKARNFAQDKEGKWTEFPENMDMFSQIE
ncbi:hypothetical protein MACK_000037 [Theileria orientalis]|uniref:Uncharacterized protein n=1 Tax=Theileria orientalis TaxID=68886 RepID=A0A976QTP0_THEOR|nr:hypothetical protein MACK_000037 [Theileria orientalis]